MVPWNLGSSLGFLAPSHTLGRVLGWALAVLVAASHLSGSKISREASLFMGIAMPLTRVSCSKIRWMVFEAKPARTCGPSTASRRRGCDAIAGAVKMSSNASKIYIRSFHL
jgi:hypothetical protein